MRSKIFMFALIFIVGIFLNGKNDLSAIEGKGDKKAEKKVITACDGETQIVLNDVSKNEVMSREKAQEVASMLLTTYQQQKKYQSIDSLLRYAVVITGNEEDAKDLVQETCYKALKSINSLDENSNVKAWLFTIMRNLWINQRKRNQISPVYLEETIENVGDEWNINPEELLINNEMRQLLLKALNDLPEAYKEILILRYFEDFSYNEISKILDCPLGTVMSKLNRAREKLKEVFLKIYEKNNDDRS
ncbi:RNA polymerase sigma factor [Candidatus Kryptobacter tengchongensis]|uniref:RNA polymerase sigma factor, sigma-70 family n=1 Tax=Kryptobacter tengchongensis TaxID=1643429 RepID=A0A916PEG2_KRYT1|nr:sigma-70 family RNA polymerase sigma factor [Candidatus Kryptobacter tengchongensis]CUT02453.1 RNA polymerase sigma factor, sigma-70 family [Candidatus Kryptobacter tengchongensis]